MLNDTIAKSTPHVQLYTSTSATYSKMRQIIKKVGPITISKNKIFCRDAFQNFILPETKTQTHHICEDQKHILTF